MSETLSLNKLEKLIELETQLRGDYQRQLDDKDATIAKLKKEQAALEAKMAELEKTISTQLATIKDMSGNLTTCKHWSSVTGSYNRSENMRKRSRSPKAV